MINEYFRLALKNIGRKKLRNSLTIIGIFVSITTIFVLMSLSIGLNNAINEQFKLLGTDKFFIVPKGQIGISGRGVTELSLKDVEVIKKVRGVRDVSYLNIGNAKIEYKNQARYYQIMGAPLDERSIQLIFETMNMNVGEGRFIKTSEKDKVVVGYEYKNIFENPVRIKSKIRLNDREFEVVGILKSTGNYQEDQSIYISIEDFKELFNSGERVDEIIVRTKESEDIRLVAEDVKKKLTDFRNLNKKNLDFEVLTPEEILKSFEVILNIITVFVIGVASISLIVGGIGIANTMYTSVLERTKEIGVMKATGAKKTDILSIFIIESGILGLVGGIAGILAGIFIGKTIEYLAVNQLKTNILRVATPWYLLAGCLLFAFLIGSFSGIMPARQASRVSPAESLRYE